jgi:hypothetical protein
MLFETMLDHGKACRDDRRPTWIILKCPKLFPLMLVLYASSVVEIARSKYLWQKISTVSEKVI